MNIKKEKVYPIQISLICPHCGTKMVFKPEPNLVQGLLHACLECAYAEITDKVYPYIEYVTKEELDEIK